MSGDATEVHSPEAAQARVRLALEQGEALDIYAGS